MSECTTVVVVGNTEQNNDTTKDEKDKILEELKKWLPFIVFGVIGIVGVIILAIKR